MYIIKRLLATSLQWLTYHKSPCVWPLWLSSASRTLASSRTRTRMSGHLVRTLVAWQVHTGAGTRSARSQICWCHTPLQPDSAQTGTGWHLQDSVTLWITCSRKKENEREETANKILATNTTLMQYRSSMDLRQKYLLDSAGRHKGTFG